MIEGVAKSKDVQGLAALLSMCPRYDNKALDLYLQTLVHHNPLTPLLGVITDATVQHTGVKIKTQRIIKDIRIHPLGTLNSWPRYVPDECTGQNAGMCLSLYSYISSCQSEVLARISVINVLDICWVHWLLVVF